jgi:hypothetical protein
MSKLRKAFDRSLELDTAVRVAFIEKMGENQVYSPEENEQIDNS